MMPKKSPLNGMLTQDDRALWKAVTAEIKPHKKTREHRKKRSLPAHKKIEPSPRARTENPIKKPGISPIPFRELPAIAPDIARHIQRKKRVIHARLDLHGLTQESAHRTAIAFIGTACQRGYKTVLVITGKGKNGQGLLRNNLPRWLGADSLTAQRISGILPAPREFGGDGAFIITLKSSR